MTTTVGDVNEATASSDTTEPAFAHTKQTNVNSISNTTNNNDTDADANEACVVDHSSTTNNDNSATTSSLRKRSRQEKQDTVCAENTPAPTVTTGRKMPEDDQQIVVNKREFLDPSRSQTTTNDVFDVTDDHIKYIIRDNGTYVDFGYCGLGPCDERPKLRDRHVIGLLTNHKHIHKQKVTQINLSDCNGITDESLVFIADHFPQLKELYAGNCDLITDKGVIAITKKCHKLTGLSYSECS